MVSLRSSSHRFPITNPMFLTLNELFVTDIFLTIERSDNYFRQLNEIYNPLAVLFALFFLS